MANLCNEKQHLNHKTEITEQDFAKVAERVV